MDSHAPECTFTRKVGYIQVILDGEHEYHWPFHTRTDQRFTTHLLKKLLKDDTAVKSVVLQDITRQGPYVTRLSLDGIDAYLPAEYRRQATKQPLWKRILNFITKEESPCTHQKP